MKKTGFTLAELMGVIVILGVLAMITIPIVDKTLKEGKEKLYETQIQNMELGLRSWAGDNVFNLPNPGEEMTLTLGQLKQAGYVELDIKDPKTKKLFPNDMLFTVRNNNGVFQYIVHEGTGTPGNEVLYNPNAPILYLNGNAYENVEVNSTYTDKGVVAKTSTGSVIDASRITKTITGSGNSVDTQTVRNKYIIAYSVTDNGLTTTIIRTLIVNDTKAPELTVPGNVTIKASDIGSFKLMDGVSATDNSGKSVTIVTSGNISSIPMNYTITYTATDQSGNKSVQKRVITVSNEVDKTLKGNIIGKGVVTSGNGLYKISDTEYKYRGGCNIQGTDGNYTCSDADPIHNYIKLGSYLYRIIGIDANGIKVISANKLLDKTFDPDNTNIFDTSDSNTNNIGYYLNKDASAIEEIKYLRTIATTAKWNIGGVANEANRPLTTVKTEEKATTSSFQIGLMNVSDYIEGSTNATCLGDPVSNSTNSQACRNNNWLFNKDDIYPWTINSRAATSNHGWLVFSSSGSLTNGTANGAYGLRSVIHLSSETPLTSGEGTSSNPWIIG